MAEQRQKRYLWRREDPWPAIEQYVENGVAVTVYKPAYAANSKPEQLLAANSLNIGSSIRRPSSL